jgi:DNA-directed RNA polymerase subunit M/transcription elongation factor TFIIS
MVSEKDIAIFYYNCMKAKKVSTKLILDEEDDEERIETVTSGIDADEFLINILDDKAVLRSILYDSEERDQKMEIINNIIEPIEKGMYYLEEPCVRCHEKKVILESVQDRSADEGETTYYKCTKCDLRKKL